MKVKELYTKKSKIFIGLYIVFIFGAAMGDYKVLNEALGALPKIISAGAIVLALLYFLWSGNFRNLKQISRFAILFSSVIIGIIFISIFIWILDLQSLPYIVKGVSKISYQFLNIAILCSAVYMFEEKAAKYTFIGIAAANLVIILIGALKTGISAAAADFIANIVTFGSEEVTAYSDFIVDIEIHDITFVMGIYILYFLFFCPGEKHRYLYALAALFFFFAGLKRIAFLSLFLGILYAVFCMVLGPKGKARLLIGTGVLIVGFSFYYIIIIQNGSFTQFLLDHDIQLSGRERIYDYIAKFYEVKPSYMGKGYEYCVQLLRSMINTSDQVIAVTAIHNDILKMYVELGFWGFTWWSIFYFLYQTNWYISRCGEKVAVCFMTITIYMFITYMTDNTTFYFWSSMITRLVPMCFFYAPVKEFQLKTNNPLDMNRLQRFIYNKRERDKMHALKPRMSLLSDDDNK